MSGLGDPRRLLVFREVARAGSLAGAARSLGWTQPAVSQHVKQLETAAGAPLVVRAGRGVTLTEGGRALLRHADAVADRLEAAEQELAALAGLHTGRVRIAAFPTAAAVLLPAVLAALLQRAPGLDIRLDQLEPPEAEAAVRGGSADLAVVFRHADDAAPVEGDLLREPLTRHPVLAVVPTGREVPVSLADLAEERWIAGCARCRSHLTRCAAAPSPRTSGSPLTTTSSSNGWSLPGSASPCSPHGHWRPPRKTACAPFPSPAWTTASSRSSSDPTPGEFPPWPPS